VGGRGSDFGCVSSTAAAPRVSIENVGEAGRAADRSLGVPPTTIWTKPFGPQALAGAGKARIAGTDTYAAQIRKAITPVVIPAANKSRDCMAVPSSEQLCSQKNLFSGPCSAAKDCGYFYGFNSMLRGP